ncbi:hypothetical protein BDZ89DRAFT_1049910 [Hymenopellis radicata]|nr:hypothetical protein BDZ89DRAFT_1049910 [Hymenopellis radicata]
MFLILGITVLVLVAVLVLLILVLGEVVVLVPSSRPRQWPCPRSSGIVVMLVVMVKQPKKKEENHRVDDTVHKAAVPVHGKGSGGKRTSRAIKTLRLDPYLNQPAREAYVASCAGGKWTSRFSEANVQALR